MATNKKAVYKVHNGTDFDKIWFETSESMLTEILQSLTGTGYRKLPGGLILQWGEYKTPSFGLTGTQYGALWMSIINNLTFPIIFPNKTLIAIPQVNTGACFVNGLPLDNRAGMNISISNFINADGNHDRSIKWFALGY